MSVENPQDATRPNRSTGPRTPEGKARCRLNAYRHGITGQFCVKTPEEQLAYDNHCRVVLETYAPVTDFERILAQNIADDLWRLNRARSIEESTFALGMHGAASDSTGLPEVDDAFAQGRTWADQARNLALLTIYEQRIQRSVDKNTVQLQALQAKRKEAARDAMRQAKDLYRFARAQGKPYQPEAFFVAGPGVPESVFSASEIAREISRDKLKSDAFEYNWRGKLPKNDAPKHPLEAAS